METEENLSQEIRIPQNTKKVITHIESKFPEDDSVATTLNRLYSEGNSTWDIGFMLGRSSSTVRSLMERFGIQRRNREEALIQSNKENLNKETNS